MSRTVASRLGLITAATMLSGILYSGAARADRPLLAGPLADHAVLQRNIDVPLTGRASPLAPVRISLGRWTTTVRANSDGVWRATVPPQRPGGPYRMIITAGAQALLISDILVGDVFVCSGQSNMELAVGKARDAKTEISRSADTELRLLKIEANRQPRALTDFAQTPQWHAAGPTTVGDYSAACFFMGQQLRHHSKVPIGLITAAVGGTTVQTWLSAPAYVANGGDAKRAALLDLLATDPTRANQEWGAVWEGWWRDSSGVMLGSPWRDGIDKGQWRAEPAGGKWSLWDVPQLKNFFGMMWYKRDTIVTAAQAAKAAALDLGRIVGIDQVWVNGQAIGNSFSLDTPRRYMIPAGLLKAGHNDITVSATKIWLDGGFADPGQRRIAFIDAPPVSLSNGWLYQTMPTGVGDPPHSPWDLILGNSILYNGMIAPIGSYPVKAVAWYQGEAHAPAPSGYGRLLRGMMADWRSQFGAKTPFMIVQIAGFGGPQTPTDYSGAARVRDEQRRAVIDDGNSRLIVTTDISEAADIHPLNKQDVGRRLALAIRDFDRPGLLPPVANPVATQSGTKVSLRFQPSSGLTAAPLKPGTMIDGFAVCGANVSHCHSVPAALAGDTIVIDAGDFPVAIIRYCWADTPVCAVRDRADLPVSPFEIPLGSGSKRP
jgi:sialate O-acetylesterase